MNCTSQPLDRTAIRRRLDASAAVAPTRSAPDERRWEELYLRRAEQYAQRSEQATERRETDRVLVFRLGAGRYGAALATIVRVVPLGRCTPVPSAPGELLGVVNVAGEIVSVVDGAALLGLPAPPDRNSGYVVLLRRAGSVVGLRVDAVEAIAEIAPGELSTADGAAASQPTRCVAGVAPEALIVLDVPQLLSNPVFQSDLTEN